MLGFSTPTPRHLVRLSRIALAVAVVDLATKAAAVRWLRPGLAHIDGWLRFAVVHNDQGAFGLSVGAYTWQLNLALTLAAVALMVPVASDLTRVDAQAPRGLGLIVGGALGNLFSLLTSPRGVVDFIALRYAPQSVLVLNVADVAAYLGLAMILRTGYRIVQQLRSEVTHRPEAALPAPVRLQPAAALFSDREVVRGAVSGADQLPRARRVVERPASHRPPVPARPARDVEERVLDLTRRLENPGRADTR